MQRLTRIELRRGLEILRYSQNEGTCRRCSLTLLESRGIDTTGSSQERRAPNEQHRAHQKRPMSRFEVQSGSRKARGGRAEYRCRPAISSRVMSLQSSQEQSSSWSPYRLSKLLQVEAQSGSSRSNDVELVGKQAAGVVQAFRTFSKVDSYMQWRDGGSLHHALSCYRPSPRMRHGSVCQMAVRPLVLVFKALSITDSYGQRVKRCRCGTGRHRDLGVFNPKES